jgi:hypothetical protein
MPNRILILFILLSSYLYSSNKIHDQNRLYEKDILYQLFESLYLSSTEINPGIDMILTYQDAKDLLALWKQRHTDPNQNQRRILNEIDSILVKIDNKNRITVRTGVDYLYHNVPDCTETNPFYLKFRDQDFETKYDERGRFFDATLDMPLYKSLFLSNRTSLKNDWKYFNKRQSDFPRALLDFNQDVNEKSILSCKLDNMFIVLGRDRLNVGTGEFSKLIIDQSMPSNNHFHFSIKYKDDLAFNFIIAWMKNALLRDETPKILYLHRLSYRFFNRGKISITEMQMTNRDLNSKYINPFMIYHNEYDYASQRNIITTADLEIALGYRSKLYSSFAVDEIDFKSIETNGYKNREAWGLIFGLKQVQPFGLFNSHWVVEWTKLTKWLYNHDFPPDNYYTVNFVYEEKQETINPDEFHRFIGHDLGANAQAWNTKFQWHGLNLFFKYVEQGKIPILELAYTQVADSVKSYNSTFGIRYKENFWNDRIELITAYYHTESKNFHQNRGLNKSYSEFWLSLNYKLFDIKW